MASPATTHAAHPASAENGEIQYPVSEITIAGNLKEMWRNIVTIGDDIETRSNIQCGSVLLPEMKIAGQ